MVAAAALLPELEVYRSLWRELPGPRPLAEALRFAAWELRELADALDPTHGEEVAAACLEAANQDLPF